MADMTQRGSHRESGARSEAAARTAESQKGGAAWAFSPFRRSERLFLGRDELAFFCLLRNLEALLRGGCPSARGLRRVFRGARILPERTARGGTHLGTVQDLLHLQQRLLLVLRHRDGILFRGRLGDFESGADDDLDLAELRAPHGRMPRSAPESDPETWASAPPVRSPC